MTNELSHQEQPEEAQGMSRRQMLGWLGRGATAVLVIGGPEVLVACAGGDKKAVPATPPSTEVATSTTGAPTTLETTTIPATTAAATTTTTEAPTTTTQPPTPETVALPEVFESQQVVGSMTANFSGTDLKDPTPVKFPSVAHSIRTGVRQETKNGFYYDVNPSFNIGYAWHTETPFPGRGGTTVIGGHHLTHINDPDHPDSPYDFYDIRKVQLADDANGVPGDRFSIAVADEFGGQTLTYEALHTWVADTNKPEDAARGFSQDDPNVQLRVYACETDLRYRTVVEFRQIS